MKIKHLQLNTSVLKNPEGIRNFVRSEDFDICNFQELVYYSDSPCVLHKIASELGLTFVEAINYTLMDDETKPVRISSCGILTKFRVIDFQIYYCNTLDDKPKHLIANDLINDNSIITSFPASRGVKHSKKSRAILRCVLDTGDKIISDITCQFNVSDLCIETTQILEMAEKVASIVRNTSTIPTIFGGDINIRLQSYSGTVLKSIMQCHSEHFVDTLAPDHIAHKDFPDGLAVDHVFSVGMKLDSIQAVDKGLSDHLAIVSQFEV